MRALPVVVLAGCAATRVLASTVPPEVVRDVPGARLQGQGKLRYLGLHVYDAALWSAQPVDAASVERAVVALELRYARALRGNLIAERSLEEMRRIGDIDDDAGERWLAAMKRIFPDVAAGDRITGVHWPGTGARFHVNGRFVDEVADATFARLFFGVWLSARTSQPQLRAALLGATT
ncbi:MAG: chalcone isomerase family protein [Aquincola sp.]|nr:chalcone isomerase family protein [Aquincola sp.]MDH5329683.1 chalcone isomerase family protein [Aquincola sp.]